MLNCLLNSLENVCVWSLLSLNVAADSPGHSSAVVADWSGFHALAAAIGDGIVVDCTSCDRYIIRLEPPFGKRIEYIDIRHEADCISIKPKGWLPKPIWREINDILFINGFSWLENGKESKWIRMENSNKWVTCPKQIEYRCEKTAEQTLCLELFSVASWLELFFFGNPLPWFGGLIRLRIFYDHCIVKFWFSSPIS